MVKGKQHKRNGLAGTALWNVSVHHGGWLLLYFVTALGLSVVMIVGNDYIAGVTDSMLAGKVIEFGALLVPLCMLTAAGVVLAYVKSISGAGYSAKVQRSLRDRMGEKLLHLPYAWFDANGTGSIMTRLVSDMGVAGRFYSEILPVFLLDIATVTVAAIYFAGMDVRLILVLFVSCPFMFLLADKVSKRIAALARSKRSRMDERTALAYDYVQGIEVGRSFGLYESQKRRMDAVLDDIAMQAAASSRISTWGWTVGSVIIQIPMILCDLFALREMMQGRISTGELLSFIVLAGYVIYHLRNVIFAVNDMREAGVSLGRLREILDGEEEGRRREELDGGTAQKQEALDSGAAQKREALDNETARGKSEMAAPCVNVPAICLKHAGFSYSISRPAKRGSVCSISCPAKRGSVCCAPNPVLQDISFTVFPGQKIAFVGGSGEGKSTILKLLCGLYDKQEGEYLLFGTRWEDWNLEAARECFSYVSQNTVLFPVSVWENVAYGKAGASREQVVEACRQANIHEMITRLPQGYDTVVGERGARLSGGERQRISIARAILKDAPILLLDEPTASVDGENERLIVEALERVAEGRTILTVAHRISTIENADIIYEIKGGRIVRQGTYAEMFGGKEAEESGGTN